MQIRWKIAAEHLPVDSVGAVPLAACRCVRAHHCMLRETNEESGSGRSLIPRAAADSVVPPLRRRRRASHDGNRRAVRRIRVGVAKSITSDVAPSRASSVLRDRKRPAGRAPAVAQAVTQMRGVRCGLRQLWINRLVANGIHEHPGAAIPNSVRNSGRDSTRPPGPATDRYRRPTHRLLNDTRFIGAHRPFVSWLASSGFVRFGHRHGMVVSTMSSRAQVLWPGTVLRSGSRRASRLMSLNFAGR